jgi:chromosome segregation ATPase
MTCITVTFVYSAPPGRHRSRCVSCACLFAFLALTQLAGCATSGDPHQGGFINGIVGLSGGYQRRLDERETILSGERAEGRRLETEQRRLEAERDAVRNELDRAQRRLAAQQQRIAAERARIQALRRQTATDRARLAELSQAQGRARAVNRTIEQADPTRDALPGLEAKTRDINREIDEIDAAVGIISGV